ncbi:phosphatidylserine decarboxylase related protein [Desulfofarcimen acetoxidans DSM 771]|uniref:Phosphatidylserine decarboxylase proenzyme n=1 Tax=Desulfofarcimen acetoxidans (strain ATCC 49208 / DSM 771 / KCTC 5769 / VKM B-1644 / 5575) TaxID=485916 RepID=C8W2L7_DESAS|nr:phosphatidylserine decarboxylase family protein [Desulfofarcimen acetoxidans]ACV63701.1 phosphatidylserine decarboxylase related protein [Desulfofarcimen acetoxidans DSM 771]
MIVKDSVPLILILLILIIIFYNIYQYLAILPAILLLFVLFFFRNPKRTIASDRKHILSPADGTILEVKELKENSYIKGEAIKISIFLSIFDVHINRSPIKGAITFTEYRPGKFLPAFKSHASDINERNTVGIENDCLKVLVHQITGFIARRIVCYMKKGDQLEQGQIFGLIKFGSCTEIIVPASVKVFAEEGQKVKGGLTVLGVLLDE